VFVPIQDRDFQRNTKCMSWSPFFNVHWVKMRCVCSFCWYWWNCWPSLLKCSFLNCVGSFFLNSKLKYSFHVLRQSWRMLYFFLSQLGEWGRGRDRIVVRFTTTSAISTYHHLRYKFESRSWRDVLDTTLCDRVYQWLTEGRWFSPGPAVSFTNKTEHDIIEILLKVALNTIRQTNQPHFSELPSKLLYRTCRIINSLNDWLNRFLKISWNSFFFICD
jgi:hypothetical protein